MNCSPPGSSVHGILQARILNWVAMPFSRDRPDPGIKFEAPALQTDSVPSEPPGEPLRRQKRGDQKHSRRESNLCKDSKSSVILLEGKEDSDIWRSRSWGAGWELPQREAVEIRMACTVLVLV